MSIPRLTITHHDGTESTVTPNLGDSLAYEAMLRKNRQLGELGSNLLMVPMFRAWKAATREGKTVQTWEEFTTGPEAALHVGNAEADDDNEGDELGLGGPTIQPTI